MKTPTEERPQSLGVVWDRNKALHTAIAAAREVLDSVTTNTLNVLEHDFPDVAARIRAARTALTGI